MAAARYEFCAPKKDKDKTEFNRKSTRIAQQFTLP